MKTSPVKTCCAVQCSNHIPAESKRIKYCSKGCANKVANSQRWKRKSIRLKRKRQIKRDGFQPETLVCEQCGKEYATSYLRQVSKTCSKPCSSLRRKIIKNRHKQKLKSRTRRNSIHHKIKDRLSSRLREVLKQRGLKKASPTAANFGCSPEELQKHLESQFKDGMSWGNYGVMGWHIDHIIPCAKFSLDKPEHVSVCFHHLNLRPLWGRNNWTRQHYMDISDLLSLHPKLFAMARGIGVI